MKCGLIIGAIVVVAAVLLFSLFSSSSTRRAAHIISFSQFMTELSSGHVRSATLQGPKIYVVFTDGRAGETYTPIVPTLVQRLLEKGVEVTAVPAEEPTPIALAVSWLPFLSRRHNASIRTQHPTDFGGDGRPADPRAETDE